MFCRYCSWFCFTGLLGHVLSLPFVGITKIMLTFAKGNTFESIRVVFILSLAFQGLSVDRVPLQAQVWVRTRDCPAGLALDLNHYLVLDHYRDP